MSNSQKKSTESSGSRVRKSRRLNRFREAVRWYRLWGTWPVWDWVEAAEQFKSRDFRLAAAYYKKGLSSQPQHPAAASARLDLSYCHYRLHDYEQALKGLATVTGSRTALRDAFILQARIEVLVGCPLSATETMRRCLTIYPEDLQSLSNHLHYALQAELPADEMELTRRKLIAAKKGLSLEDDRVQDVNTALAHYELKCGEIRLGERLLARVLATGCAPFEAVLLRGERYLEQGRLLQAREQLTRAMTAAPRDPRPVVHLSRSYLRSGPDFNPAYALQLAESACKLSQWKNAECLNVLAQAYEASDRKSDAQLFFEKMKTLASTRELSVRYFQSSFQQLRPQKVSQT